MQVTKQAETWDIYALCHKLLCAPHLLQMSLEGLDTQHSESVLEALDSKKQKQFELLQPCSLQGPMRLVLLMIFISSQKIQKGKHHQDNLCSETKTKDTPFQQHVERGPGRP